MLAASKLKAGEIHVVVASNFYEALSTISKQFETKTGHNVTLMPGSTGKHYAQIKNGAPFDVFFAADIRRPKLLEQEGAAVYGSRFTYAIGKVVLWSPRNGFVDLKGHVLNNGEFYHLAIANPKLAPYGRAAREVLKRLGLWDKLMGLIVRGENISQTFQFVKSGNADLGFVARSQVHHSGRPLEGSWWDIPQELYTPIEQQAVLLKDGEVARTFLTFVRSDKGHKIIHSYGYGTP